jgi:hypothetical protein
MKKHKLVLRAGTALHEKYGPELYGVVSKIDVANGRFLLLPADTVGMLGRDGIEVLFSDCVSVFAESHTAGVYDSDEQIGRWRQWHSTSGLTK